MTKSNDLVRSMMNNNMHTIFEYFFAFLKNFFMTDEKLYESIVWRNNFFSNCIKNSKDFFDIYRLK